VFNPDENEDEDEDEDDDDQPAPPPVVATATATATGAARLYSRTKITHKKSPPKVRHVRQTVQTSDSDEDAKPDLEDMDIADKCKPIRLMPNTCICVRAICVRAICSTQVYHTWYAWSCLM
jgi:hypothetical protein